jgi:hypothetical protein
MPPSPGGSFLKMLSRYINGGWFTHADGLMSGVFPSLVFRKNAKLVIRAYKNDVAPSGKKEKITLSIPQYSGSNIHVREMMKALHHFEAELAGAFIHGSMATGEETSYSDFDALIIIHDKIFHSSGKLAKLAKRINNLRKIMHKADPLQHHGWFVLPEKNLAAYRDTYLPVAVLRNSRSLLSGKEVKLSLAVIEGNNYDIAFERLCVSLKKKLSVPYDKWNLYQLKSIFSEFMMLPSLYMQAQLKKGVSKKESFELMRMDFDPADYSVMDEISLIRKSWTLQLPEEELKFLLRTDYYSIQKRKRKNYEIPVWLVSKLNQNLFSRMNNLVVIAEKKVKD